VFILPEKAPGRLILQGTAIVPATTALNAVSGLCISQAGAHHDGRSRPCRCPFPRGTKRAISGGCSINSFAA